MQHIPEHLRGAIDPLPTKSAKIRALNTHGIKRADIARMLDIRYQHVRNVLERDRAKAEAGKQAVSVPRDAAPVTLSIENGRILLPPQIVDAMALSEDGTVSALVQDGELSVMSPRAAFLKAKSIAARHKKPGESVVDAFLAERRSIWNEQG